VSEIPFGGCTMKQALSTLRMLLLACRLECSGIHSAVQNCISTIFTSFPEASVSDVLQPLLQSIRASAVVIFSRTISFLSSNLKLKAALFLAVKNPKMETDQSALVRQALSSCAATIIRHTKGSFATSLVSIVTTLAADHSA
jgi:hypothetical protein